MRLTDAQKRFCDEYLISLNATQAYKAAYPAVKKDETAKSAGSRLLTNVDITAYIKKRQEEIALVKGITRERIVERLAAIAFGDPTEIATVTGDKRKKIKVANFDDLTQQQKRMIAGVEPVKLGQGNGIKVKMHDTLKATEMLIKLLGFDQPAAVTTGETGIAMLPPLDPEPEDDEDEPE